MVIVCPKCGAKYQLTSAATGTAQCRQCGAQIEVTSGDASDRSAAGTVITDRPSAPEPAASDRTSRADSKTVISTPGAETPAERSQAATIPSTPAPGAEQRSQANTMPSSPAPQPPSAPTTGSRRSEGEDPLVGHTLGGYEVLRKLGQGGMGAVYEARQLSLDRSVALKVLPANLAADRNFITRFLREAHAVARLNHANIIQIYDVGQSGGIYFFAMEFVQGRTLDDLLRDKGRMNIETAVGYIVQAARGMAYAHRKHIIHRDIKPDNIMVNEEGVAKVADLGLAKELQEQEHSVTLSGVAMGTPYYMAPEQATDAKRADHRADIYSLGCTLYQLVTGKLPFDGSSAYEIITKHVQTAVRPPHELDPSVSEELSAIIRKMLEKNVDARYQRMEEVIEDLEKFLGVSAAAGWQPTEEQIRILRDHADRIETIRRDKKSRVALLGLSALVVLAAMISVRVGWRFGVGVAAFSVAGLIGYGAALGTRRKTHLYRIVRKYLFGNKLGDWVTFGVVALVVVGLAILLGVWGHLLVGALLGVGAGVAYFVLFKRPLLKRIDDMLEEIRTFLRSIRRQGVSEPDLHLFVCRHGGADGEYLCEALFGYEAVRETRPMRSPEELERRKTLVNVREWMIDRMEAAEQAREEAKRRPARPAAEAGDTMTARTELMTGADIEKADTEPAPVQMTRTDAVIEAEVIEDIEGEEKPGAAAMLLGVPKFLISGKGRVAVGALLLLLAGLSMKGVLLAGSVGLQSYGTILFALALLVSGFVRSRAMLACLALCCVLTGPVAWATGPESLPGRPISVPLLNRLGEEVTANFTLTFIGGVFFFLLAFAAGIIFRGGRPAASAQPKDAGAEA